jgi:diguanylate cyclase (GGDEF)-like protein
MSSFAVITTLGGTLEKCLFDNSGAQFAVQVGGEFSLAFGEEWVKPLVDFLSSLTEADPPANIEITDPFHADERTLLISGGQWEDQLVITGVSLAPNVSQSHLKELMCINNQQVNMLRSMIKEYESHASKDDKLVMVEMTELNNQMMGMQRTLAKQNHELERQMRQMTLLNRMNEALQMCEMVEDVYKAIAIFTEKLFDSSGGRLYIYRPEVEKFSSVASWGMVQDDEGNGFDTDGFLQVLNEKSNARQLTGYLEEKSEANCLFMRFPQEENLIGILQVLLNRRVPAGDPFFAEFQKTFLLLIGLAIKNTQYREMLVYDTMVDHLTGMYNRRFLTMQMDREVSRATRQGSYMSVVMLDLDDFKLINDDYGHLVGDQYLNQFADILTGCVRKEDYVCRYGGDEFALVLSESSKQDALMVIDRIKHNTRSVLINDRTMSIEFSAGAATFPDDGQTPAELMHKADQVLYLMKSRRAVRE